MAKKRANGEGSIRKKPNGRWEGRYTQGIDPSTGRDIQKSVSARTQAECKEKLAKAIRDNRGIPVNHNEDYTVAEWCRLWFETYSKPVIRPKRCTMIPRPKGGCSGSREKPTRLCLEVRCGASTWCCPRR